MSTAASHLYAAVQQAIRDEHPTFDLTVLDGLDLLDGLAHQCPAHKTCPGCDEPLCWVCDINTVPADERADGCDGDHCADCWQDCDSCRSEASAEAAADLNNRALKGL